MLWIAVAGCLHPAARALELEVVKGVDGVTVRILNKEKTPFPPISSNAGLVVMSPQGRTPVCCAEAKREDSDKFRLLKFTAATGGAARE